MVWKYLWTFVLGIVFLYLQVLVMPALSIGGISTNILLPWLIYCVWMKPINVAAVTGFVIGLMYDSTMPSSFGLNAIIFVILCVVIDLFRKPFEAESMVAKLLTLLTANVVYALISHLVLGLSFGFDTKLFNLILLGFIYNLAFSFVFFFVMKFLSRLRVVAVE